MPPKKFNLSGKTKQCLERRQKNTERHRKARAEETPEETQVLFNKLNSLIRQFFT